MAAAVETQKLGLRISLSVEQCLNKAKKLGQKKAPKGSAAGGRTLGC